MATQKDSGRYPYIITIILVLILGAVLLINTLQQKAGSPVQELGFVEVSAAGYAYGTPSQALVYITVNGSGNTSAGAVSNLASTLGQLNSTLLHYVNGNASQIKTQSLSVYQQCSSYVPPYTQYKQVLYPGCNQTNYEAQEGIVVTLPNVNNVSSLVGSVSQIPNVLVGSVSVQRSDSQASALRDTALQNALSNATSQAGVLAGGKNLTLINVSVDSYYAYPFAMTMGSSTQHASSAPVFYAGRYQVSETVSARFSYVR